MSARIDHNGGRASAQPQSLRAATPQSSITFNRPEIEPDIEWKTGLQARIREELRPMVDDAKLQLDLAINRARAQFNEEITRIGKIEQERYNSDLATERRRRSEWVSRASSRPPSTVHPVGIPRMHSSISLERRAQTSSPHAASNPLPSSLPREYDVEPSDEWKHILHKNVHRGLFSMLQEATSRYKVAVGQAGVTEDERGRLEHEYLVQKSEITQMAAGQYQEELERERQRRMAAATQSLRRKESRIIREDSQNNGISFRQSFGERSNLSREVGTPPKTSSSHTSNGNRRVVVEDQLSGESSSEESNDAADSVDEFIKSRCIAEEQLKREKEQGVQRNGSAESDEEEDEDAGSESDNEEKIVLQFPMELDGEKHKDHRQWKQPLSRDSPSLRTEVNGQAQIAADAQFSRRRWEKSKQEAGAHHELPPQQQVANDTNDRKNKHPEESQVRVPRHRESKIVLEDDDAISISDPNLIEQQKHIYQQIQYAKREEAIKQRKRNNSIVQESSTLSSPSTQSPGSSPNASRFSGSRRASDVNGGHSRTASTANTSPSQPSLSYKNQVPVSPTHSRTPSNALPIANSRARTGSINQWLESPTQYTAADWKRRQAEQTNGNSANATRVRSGSIQQSQSGPDAIKPGTSPKSLWRSTSPAISRSASTMPSLSTSSGSNTNLFWRPTHSATPRSASTVPTHTPVRPAQATYSSRVGFN